MASFKNVIKSFKGKNFKEKAKIVGETVGTGGINIFWRAPKLNDEAVAADYRAMKAHDQHQNDEDVVAARNLAILLIGSDDNDVKQNALDCYKRNTNKLLDRGFTDIIIPGKRRYVHVGESVESIGGADLMDESKQTVVWFFDIERVPKDLVFQQGHPQPNTLYIEHPLLPNRYYLRENIEYVLFKEKILEFIKLMRCLGATKISFQSKKRLSESEKKKYAVDIETEVGVKKVVGVGVDPKGSYTEESKHLKDNTEEMLLLFTPKNKIYVPDDLVWYKSNQEGWEEIVSARMDRSYDQYNIHISTKQTNVVSKELDAKVKSKFRYLFVGVKGDFAYNQQKIFTEDEEFEWSIHVDFAPLDESLIPIREKEKQEREKREKEEREKQEKEKQEKQKRKNRLLLIIGGVAVALTAGLIISLI